MSHEYFGHEHCGQQAAAGQQQQGYDPRSIWWQQQQQQVQQQHPQQGQAATFDEFKRAFQTSAGTGSSLKDHLKGLVKHPAPAVATATNIVKEKPSMFKGLTDDLRGFIKDNKSVLYWIAILLIVDHYFFDDHFREKLKSLVHSLIGKVEKQIGETNEK